ncbi:MAG: hypothetical protein U9Q83_11405 [Bacteroidota bacterium]|nr:hypothetical protein [Bacteroidota bacterium]
MKKIILVLIISFSFFGTKAQFYNGLHMSFGKNRVQYKSFAWRYYPKDSFDVYFYERGYNLGKYATLNISGVMNEMETFFGTNLNEHVLFVVYNKLTDFRQSNVGLETENIDFNTGGQMQLLDNKAFVYYNGDHFDFLRQIRKVIAKLYLQQIIYGSAFKERITTSAMLNVPTWFESGLVSYMSQPYDIDVFNKTKDLLVSKKRINFNHLNDEEAEYIGHSFWYYIADQYGEEIISNLLYFSKVSKSIKNATYFVLGRKLKVLTDEWRVYFENNLIIDDSKLPDENTEIKVTKKNRTYSELKISPDGKNIAYVQNFDGKYKVFLYNIKTQKKKKLYKEGHRLDQIVDLSYPVLAWNYSGKILAFTTEKKGNVNLWLYYLDKNELKPAILPYISKVNTFDFSPKGASIVFSAVANGFTDLFVFNLLAGKMNRITNDLADDLNPKFNNNSTKIIFSSNRTTDTLKRVYSYEEEADFSDNFDLYVYDFKSKSNVLTRLTNTNFSNEMQPINVGQDSYIYTSDYSGIKNRYALKFDSTISFIDTAVHYRYFSNSYPISNYSRNILSHDSKRNFLSEIIYYQSKYRLYEYKFPINNLTKLKTKEQFSFFAKRYIDEQEKILKQKKLMKQKLINEKKQLDSLRPFLSQKINTPDSSFVDVNYYVFEIEKDTLFKRFYLEQKKQEVDDDSDSSIFPQMRVYQKTFYLDDAMSQIDFSMLNQTYQPFTGGAFQFIPGMSYFTTFNVNELFNDYKLIGGFRFSLNGSMEYLFSVENLEKRLDKQIIFHRQVLKQEVDSYFYPPVTGKTKTNELIFMLRYPFSQVSSVKLSFVEKYDREIILSTEYTTLVYPDSYNIYSGAKFEYIFDNTRELSINLYDGVKFKLFGEFYQQINGNYDYTAVLGGDFRISKSIFHNLVFASRIGGSTSFGTGKVIYYLGGVDNWVDLSFGSDNSKYFDESVNINYEQNYLFQAVATNMRGFSQNIRNGNSFIVMNNELRMPIVQMLMPYPINSDFWHNLQVVGFFDIGSAWAGLSPYDEKNLYNTIITQRKPFSVIVDVDRPPYVYGYGFGLRTKLLGYFFRMDWAWGIEGNYHHDRMFYFSLSKDF